ncbi:MAG: NAD(P)/FAD-dependent oxidoreductase [Bryobacteraceae bacterium]
MVRIIGGGPAGAAAAIAASGAGAEVEIYEESPVPRHKVCGEFLTPEALPVLDRLGVLKECSRERPAHVSRLIVHVGTCEKRARLPEAGWGISRYHLDRILLDRAASLGARVIAERGAPETADVVASGQPGWAPSPAGRTLNLPLLDAFQRPARTDPPLYGFKAHFRGQGGDTAELYFFSDGYVGVSPVENGLVSVCGLVRSYLLRAKDLDPDAFLASRPELAARTRFLSRATDWLLAGSTPRDIEYDLYQPPGPYRAGDALGPPEPFTGSGVLDALLSGQMAGIAAVRRTPAAAYLQRVENVLWRSHLFGSIIRTAFDTGWGRVLAPIAPLRWFFRRTRPSLKKME